jgi:CubicO group peptidase (beta-lactamase class C family)
MSDLLPLPGQPEGTRFPGERWPTGDCPSAARQAVQRLFEDEDEIGHTLAVVVVQGGRLVCEQYAPTVEASTPLISWSMAKSFMGVTIGMLVGDGLLNVAAPAPVPEWADDDRSLITLQNLLQMRSGLEFVEDYVDGDISHCIQMLFGEGEKDVAAYAIARPALHAPGTVWNYSSGEANILAKIAADALGGSEQLIDYLRDRLFEPLGMTSADPRCDAAGLWIASSFLYATAQDFARFGLFMLRDGVWDGQRLLPDGWLDAARSPHIDPDENGLQYGEQFWTTPDGRGRFSCNGYEGQYIHAVPSSDAVVVRLGKTDAAIRDALVERISLLVATLD